MQIKDDVCAQGVGREHDKTLLAVLHRFKEYGITLRREKCRLGQPEVMLGNVFHKGSMSPDPDKVDTIKGWPAPEDKTALKSFLQTIQFCSPFMRAGEGQAGEAFQVDSFIQSPCNSTNLHQIPYQCPGTVRR